MHVNHNLITATDLDTAVHSPYRVPLAFTPGSIEGAVNIHIACVRITHTSRRDVVLHQLLLQYPH